MNTETLPFSFVVRRKLRPLIAFTDEYRELVGNLANGLIEVSVPRARAELRNLLGKVRVDETPEALEFWSEHGAEAALLQAAGSDKNVPR